MALLWTVKQYVVFGGGFELTRWHQITNLALTCHISHKRFYFYIVRIFFIDHSIKLG